MGLSGSALAEDEAEALAALGPGGVVLFARNVSTLEATRSLVAAARDACGGTSPLLVCVDQEGGRVARLRFGPGPLPSALALGAAGNEGLAERAGTFLAAQLRAIDANVDLAPVLDLALEPRNTVIGTRSLGDDPERVARLGAALVCGLQRGGVAAVAKHFPGHGATPADSHLEVPVVAASAATLRAREFVPFAAAVAAGVRGVMTGHLLVPALDAEQPATLSPRVIGEVLRGELGFGGVCFTDCLEMGAVEAAAGTARGAALALAAGADCLLVSHDLALARAARDEIVRAVAAGTVPLARLREASARVAALRAEFAASASGDAAPASDLPAEVAARALVLVRGRASLDAARPVTVISFEGVVSDGIASMGAERASLALALRRRRVRAESLRVSLSPDAAMREMLAEVVRAQGERNVVLVARRAHLYPDQAAALDDVIAAAPDAIAVSALEPFDLPQLFRARNVRCSFGDEEPNVEALADVLCGRRSATGTLPVSLALA